MEDIPYVDYTMWATYVQDCLWDNVHLWVMRVTCMYVCTYVCMYLCMQYRQVVPPYPECNVLDSGSQLMVSIAAS